MTAKTAPTAQPTEAPIPVNDVHLVGRLAAEPVRRALPSGDVLVSFRLVVTRTPAPRRRGGARTPTVDTLDCAAWRADVQRALARLSAGDVVEAHGSLRRRFWRAGAAAVSRSEVEVVRLKRVATAS
jgi:single-strand DNA-binding protein